MLNSVSAFKFKRKWVDRGLTKMKGSKGERGSILVTSAIAMSSLILMAGLAIDISHFYVIKTELQNAVDAAALAGASGLNGKQPGINAAMCRAVTTLNANKYGFNNKQFVNGANLPCSTLEASLGAYVTFSASIEGGFTNKSSALAVANTINFVKVSTPPVNVPIFFASMVLGGSRSIEAAATAGLSPSSNIFCDIAPFSVIECDDPNASGCSLATPPATQVLMSDGVTPCPSQTRLTKGCVYVVKASGGGSSGPAPGTYQLLALSGPGANDVRIAAAGSVDTCIKADGCIRTKTGNVSGPVGQGINTRFGEYGAGLDPQNFPPDINVNDAITHAQYLSTTNNSRREILVPIIPRSQFTGLTGVGTVCARGVGRFFIQKRVPNGSSDITLEYISEKTSSGRGGFVPGMGTGNRDFVVPVLYR